MQMLKGGVIMDVVNAEQARIAEEAGAVAVMALERVPADIRADGGVARMSDPGMIKEIMAAVTIPVMAKVRIGHFVEAQIIEAVGVDYIDESEVLTPADEELHINKHKFKVRKSAATAAHSHFGSLLRQELVLSSCCSCVLDVTQVPFVCGCRNLGEALRRIDEGASMIRTKGEAGTGNVVEAVRHARAVHREIKQLCSMDEDELFMFGAACPPLRARLPAAAALRPHACTAGSPLRPLHSQADWRFVRAGQEDQGDGPSSGCQLCCRRRRNAG